MRICAFFKSGIGNLIVATPALQALATMDDRQQIDICFDRGWVDDPRIPAIIDMIANMPFIDQIVRHPGDIQLSDYDKWFLPCQCELTETGKDLIKILGREYMLDCNVEWRKSLACEIDVNMANARRLGYKGESPELYTPLAKTPILKGERPYIGLCNGAFNAQMWDKKRWPYFGQLAEQLKAFYGGTIIGVGGPDELKGVPVDIDYTDKLKMTETAKAISQLDLFITTDTGCMHIADALRIDMICLFGPTLVSKNGPQNGMARIARSSVPCLPCQYHERFYECQVYMCMNNLSVSDVMEQVQTIMKKKGEKDYV